MEVQASSQQNRKLLARLGKEPEKIHSTIARTRRAKIVREPHAGKE